MLATRPEAGGGACHPLPLLHSPPVGLSRDTNLWRTWHQLQLKVRSEDTQASQLRCCKQAAREKVAVPQQQTLQGPPRTPKRHNSPRCWAFTELRSL